MYHCTTVPLYTQDIHESRRYSSRSMLPRRHHCMIRSSPPETDAFRHHHIATVSTLQFIPGPQHGTTTLSEPSQHKQNVMLRSNLACSSARGMLDRVEVLCATTWVQEKGGLLACLRAACRSTEAFFSCVLRLFVLFFASFLFLRRLCSLVRRAALVTLPR